jgi:uncharacterized repeat protein (TIGR01451 family)
MADWRRAAFAALATVCVAVAVGYGAWAAHRSGSGRAASAKGSEGTSGDSAAAPALLDGSATVMFRNGIGGGDWAHIALVPATAPAGSRIIVPLRCRRLHFAGGRGLCLAEDPGLGMAYDAHVFGSDFKVLRRFPLSGIPSRARVSPDGRYGATTVFVSGHSYAGGDFSTETTIFDPASEARLGTLEEFTVWRDDKRFKAVDFNFWGVTFGQDANRFYATLQTRGETYLVEGDIAARSMRVLRPNVECPSLSPEGTRIAFKKRVGGTLGAVTWRFHVLDLRTMAETPLAEARSIDDQIEWLDDQFVLYGVQADVWVVPVDGSGEPRRFVNRAFSPAVIRTALNTPLPREARTLTLPASDIAVTMSAASNQAQVGQDLTYTVTVTNNGPAAATQVGIDVRLSPGASFSTFAPVGESRSPYSCYAQSEYFSCTLDRLTPRETRTMQFIVRPMVAGPLHHRVTVGAAQPDPVPANDGAAVEVRVM